MKKIQSIYWVLFLYSLSLILGLVYCDGTGDMGDSIAHFIFAQSAPQHPEFYFHHWAKPVFVLLASPFAQFGFSGVKFFNIILSLLSAYFTYRVAEKLKLKTPWLAALLLACMPLNYILTLSSLTEPLFAFFVIVSIYLCFQEKYSASFILISFLPYVRSEGLIILSVFLLFAISKNKWKALPYFLVGSVIYGIAGYAVHHNLFWVITDIPYAHLSSVYGSGSLFHFVVQLTNVVGVPIYILLSTGILVGLSSLLRKHFSAELHILIFGGFLIFFVAHSLFWYLGIFNSMGLIRVFLGVAPMMAVIALCGYNFIVERFNKHLQLKYAISKVLVLYVVLFPITPNPSAIQFKKDLMAREEKTLSNHVAEKVKSLNKADGPIMYNHYYLGIALINDRFDPSKRIPLLKSELKNLKSGNIVVWDNKLVGSETDILKIDLDVLDYLKPIVSYSSEDYGQEIIYAIYQKK